MKPAVASFLSISAIVVAGGAALAVNAKVFDAPSTSAASNTPEVLAVAASGAQPAEANTGIGALGSQEVSGLTTTTTVSDQTSTTALSDYEIPGVGVVSITQNGSTIAITNVTTNAGYNYTTSEPFPGRLDVRFTSATTEIEFDAQLIDGRIVTVIKSRAFGTAGPSGSKATSRGDREKDDDREGDREHDEEDDD